MLKYAIILLDNCSDSYCVYESEKKKSPISNETLERAIRWAMMENLEIQFVYPSYSISDETLLLVDSVSHINIMGVNCPYCESADILLVDNISSEVFPPQCEPQTRVLRIKYSELNTIISLLAEKKNIKGRLNFIITDRNQFSRSDIVPYYTGLTDFADWIIDRMVEESIFIHSNLLTDRLFLKKMNNCNAGDESIVISPEGNFYICPAFYYSKEAPSGDVWSGLNIKNSQLYKYNRAPICCHCDAYQCSRCVWMNKCSTLEVNTPSQGQCLSAHIERNASRYLLSKIKDNHFHVDGMNTSIPMIDYLDPLENINNWDILDNLE